MYAETLDKIALAAQGRARLAYHGTLAYLIHAALAGAYVGLGIILIFSISTPLIALYKPFASLIMGATFGIALSLVALAGSYLFTGDAMIMPVGLMSGKCTWRDLIMIFCLSYLGNFVGAAFVAGLTWQANIFGLDPTWVLTVAAKKMSAPFWENFFRGVLCNWLVVLAVWCSFHLKSESGKLIMIWWCLFGFIGSGYEHSIANMTLLTLANFLPHGSNISWAGWVNNLIPVTLGNIVSGVVFIAFAYFYINKKMTETTS